MVVDSHFSILSLFLIISCTFFYYTYLRPFPSLFTFLYCFSLEIFTETLSCCTFYFSRICALGSYLLPYYIFFTLSLCFLNLSSFNRFSYFILAVSMFLFFTDLKIFVENVIFLILTIFFPKLIINSRIMINKICKHQQCKRNSRIRIIPAYYNHRYFVLFIKKNLVT